MCSRGGERRRPAGDKGEHIRPGWPLQLDDGRRGETRGKATRLGARRRAARRHGGARPHSDLLCCAARRLAAALAALSGEERGG